MGSSACGIGAVLDMGQHWLNGGTGCSSRCWKTCHVCLPNTFWQLSVRPIPCISDPIKILTLCVIFKTLVFLHCPWKFYCFHIEVELLCHFELPYFIFKGARGTLINMDYCLHEQNSRNHYSRLTPTFIKLRQENLLHFDLVLLKHWIIQKWGIGLTSPLVRRSLRI